jgi:hypothetical protein
MYHVGSHWSLGVQKVLSRLPQARNRVCDKLSTAVIILDADTLLSSDPSRAKPNLSFIKSKDPKEDGTVRGEFALPTLPCSPWKVLRSSGRRMRLAILLGKRVISCFRSREPMEGGARVTRFGHRSTDRTRSLTSFAEQSCETEVYTENADSQVVQTSWAAMALMYAHYPERRPIEHAVQLVMSRQLSVRPPVYRFMCDILMVPYIGWFMGARGDRGSLQQKLRYRISQLQVLVHNLDARESTFLSSAIREI